VSLAARGYGRFRECRRSAVSQILRPGVSQQGSEIDLPKVNFEQVAFAIEIHGDTYGHTVLIDILCLGYHLAEMPRLWIAGCEKNTAHAAVRHILDPGMGKVLLGFDGREDTIQQGGNEVSLFAIDWPELAEFQL